MSDLQFACSGPDGGPAGSVIADAAERATGTRTADILIASTPGLWVGAVAHGFLQPFTPTGISNYPSFTS